MWFSEAEEDARRREEHDQSYVLVGLFGDVITIGTTTVGDMAEGSYDRPLGNE